MSGCKPKKFSNFNEYEDWTERFDNCCDYEKIPVLIDDGWKISADMTTECKSWKTALRRFAKVFGDADESVKEWIEFMRDAADCGQFHEKYIPIITKDDDGSFYSWGIEDVGDDIWYVYLNVSGVYAHRSK